MPQKRRFTETCRFTESSVKETTFQRVGLTTVDEFRERIVNHTPPTTILPRRKRKCLSFSDELDEEECDTRVMKDPSAATDFLRDTQRDAALAEKRAKLLEEYNKEQEKIRNESLEVEFIHWTGKTGSKRRVTVTKGTTIQKFLAVCAPAVGQNLMFVKDCLILPHYLSFYDLWRDEIKGKSGAPLVTNGSILAAPDDISEALTIKVVERRCYDKHKHQFPANRWMPLDPKSACPKQPALG